MSETSGVKKALHHENSRSQPSKPITSFVSPTDRNCVICKEKYPLYVCSQFKALSHDDKMTVQRDNNLCRNCLQGGHFQRKCKSKHKCNICQKPHHTLCILRHAIPLRNLPRCQARMRPLRLEPTRCSRHAEF